jgi:Uma2 family endonuclease
MLPAEIKRHRFTAEEYHKMVEVGLLREDARVELIGGEIVEMSPIGWLHAGCVNRLTKALVRLVGDRYEVSVQNPIALGEGDEPQPDLALAKEDPNRRRLPGSEDVMLVVEVSDTTLAYDKNVKLPLYAGAGIPEVWIVDLQGRKAEIHTNPGPGGYRSIHEVGPGQQIRAATVEGLSLPVDDVLG